MKYLICCMVLVSSLSSHIIFDFNKNSSISNWIVVDDVVMGGKSNGNFQLNKDGKGVFYGKISLDRLDEIIDRTRKGGAEVVKLLQTGSAFYGPAASGVEMAESYLKDQNKTLPCAAYLNGEYGINDLYVGVPVIIGANGIKEVVELDLDTEEKKHFDISIDAVKELFDAAKKIDPSLI